MLSYATKWFFLVGKFVFFVVFCNIPISSQSTRPSITKNYKNWKITFFEGPRAPCNFLSRDFFGIPLSVNAILHLLLCLSGPRCRVQGSDALGVVLGFVTLYAKTWLPWPCPGAAQLTTRDQRRSSHEVRCEALAGRNTAGLRSHPIHLYTFSEWPCNTRVAIRPWGPLRGDGRKEHSSAQSTVAQLGCPMRIGAKASDDESHVSKQIDLRHIKCIKFGNI